MNGIMDRIVPEPVLTYTTFEVWTGEGNFAPDPDQNSDDIFKAIEDMVENPLNFQVVYPVFRMGIQFHLLL